MAIPWWGKIGAKIVLSRLPLDYRVWQRVGIFKHGQMDTGAYSLGVFNMHVEFAQLTGSLRGKTLVELGPGDGIATALLAAAHGAQAILIDTGAYVRADLKSVFALSSQLRAAGLNCPDLRACGNIDEVLAACGAQYLTQGLDSLRAQPAASVDMIFSQSVLEHVRKRHFAETMSECRRILNPAGAFTNHVDLKDHLGGALNNLRFSEERWESPLFSESGFYTNRIRCSDMLSRFRDAGFDVEWARTVTWQLLPTPRTKLAPPFNSLGDDELKISAFDVLLRPGAP